MTLKPPPAGEGVHSWLLATANRLRAQQQSPAQITAILRAATQDCGRAVPDREITATVEKAFQDSPMKPRKGIVPLSTRKPSKKPSNTCPAIRAGLLKAWRACLTSTRDGMIPPNIWTRFFRKEKLSLVLIRLTRAAKSCTGQVLTNGAGLTPQVRTAHISLLARCPASPSRCQTASRVGGVRKTSRHFAMLLESDTVPANEFVRWVMTLPIHIQSIVSSGGKSIHALWRVEAPDAATFRAESARAVRLFARFGIDRACTSPCRLTRLPGFERTNTGGFQTLWFARDSASIDTTPLIEQL